MRQRMLDLVQHWTPLKSLGHAARAPVVTNVIVRLLGVAGRWRLCSPGGCCRNQEMRQAAPWFIWSGFRSQCCSATLFRLRQHRYVHDSCFKDQYRALWHSIEFHLHKSRKHINKSLQMSETTPTQHNICCHKSQRCKSLAICRPCRWVMSWAIPGLGIFCEAYFIFSVGTIKPIWTAQYPACWQVWADAFMQWSLCLKALWGREALGAVSAGIPISQALQVFHIHARSCRITLYLSAILFCWSYA